jgi:lysophospholipase L1-like esterase
MFDTAIRLIALPVLAAQGFRVRRTAQSLPEAAGLRHGICGTGPTLRLRVIGDSSGAGVGVDHQQDALSGQLALALGTTFTVDWHLDALTGATTRSTLARLESNLPSQADIVVTALGVNDVTRLMPTRLWLRHQHQLFARIKTLYAPRQIYLSGMPPLEHFPLLPNPLRWTLARHGKKLERALTSSLAGNTAITYMPFTVTPKAELMASDGFHPSAVLYTLWAKELASRIISDWPSLSQR